MKDSNTSVKIRMGKYMVQNLFYPAFLGSFFFSIVGCIAAKLRDANAANFLSDDITWLLLKLFLALSIIAFYCCDYLYSKVTSIYNATYFILDFVAIAVLTFSFYATKIDMTGQPNMHSIVVPFLVFFVFFCIWDFWKLRKIDRDEDSNEKADNRKFFRNLAIGQAIGLLALSIAYLLFCLNVLNSVYLSAIFIVILLTSSLFYFSKVGDKEKLK